jgi:hypothetical protein
MRREELTLSHLRRLKVREYERHDLGEDIDWEPYLKCEYKYAVLDEGEVIMAMGIKAEGDVGWSWMLASDAIYASPVRSMRQVMETQREGIASLGLRALFTFNPPEGLAARRFLERLGYRERGRDDRFEDGKERILYVLEVA